MADYIHEKSCFEAVYGNNSQFWDCIDYESERPDIHCYKNGRVVLGVEVTRCFSDETDARLSKIPNYVQLLVEKGEYLHKDDRINPNLILGPVTYCGKNKQNLTLAGIGRKLPSDSEACDCFRDRLMEKEEKISEYYKVCSTIDLIVSDESRLFSEDRFAGCFAFFWRNLSRSLIVGSQFRELYLLRNTVSREKRQSAMALKASLLLDDILSFHSLFAPRRKAFGVESAEDAFSVLFAFLNLAGFGASKVFRDDADDIVIEVGVIRVKINAEGFSISNIFQRMDLKSPTLIADFCPESGLESIAYELFQERDTVDSGYLYTM